jgi:hypothetical protein
MSLLFALLQQLGSMSPSLQRVLIHLLQPIVLGALFYLGVVLSDHPLSFIGVGVLCLGLVAYIANLIRKERLENAEPPLQSVIVPKITPDPKDSHSLSPSPPPPPPDSSSLHSPIPSSGSGSGVKVVGERGFSGSESGEDLDSLPSVSRGAPLDSSSDTQSHHTPRPHFPDDHLGDDSGSLQLQSDSSRVGSGSLDESSDQLDDFLRNLDVVDHESDCENHSRSLHESRESGDDQSSVEEVEVDFGWNESNSSNED